MSAPVVTQSILISIKRLLGIEPDYTDFDTDIIMNINGVFMTLGQLGIGDGRFSISGYAEEWSDFCSNARTIDSVKMYIYLKVRQIFDPPNSSAVADAIARQIQEYEWRLNSQAEGDGEA